MTSVPALDVGPVPRRGTLGKARAHLDRRPSTWAWMIILAGTFVRLVYGSLVNDPMSGPDANGFEPQGQVLATSGLLANVCGMVNRHAGYPVAIGMVYDVFGAHQRAFVAVQVILVGLGSYFAYTLAARELGHRVGLVAVALLMLSPALAASSTEFMYEPLLGAGLAGGLDLVSRAVRASRRRGIALAVGGGVVLGLSATVHPKALAIALPIVALLLLRRRPRLALALPCIAGLMVGPVALGARTAVATGRFDLNDQLGLSMLKYNATNNRLAVPARKSSGRRVRRRAAPARAPASPAKPCIAPAGYAQAPVGPGAQARPAPARPPARDRNGRSGSATRPPEQRRTASIQAASAGDVTLLGPKLRDFWGPMVLPAAQGHGSWFHGLTVARLAPSSIETRPWFLSVERVGEYLWSGLGAALVLLGTLVILRDRSRRPAAMFVVLPVLVLLAVSLYTVAEARFRLPASPFYSALQALALVWLAARLRGTRHGRRIDVTAGQGTRR